MAVDPAIAGICPCAVVTSTLGIGDNTAMFRMLSALILQRLAIDDCDGLSRFLQDAGGPLMTTSTSASFELPR